MSLVKQFVILAVFALGGGALWVADVPALLVSADGGGRTNASGGGKGDAVAVIARPVRLASEATMVQAPGTGIAVKSVTLFPESDGRVTEILFTAGQKVKKGDPLLRLDDRAERLALELAQVHVKEARRKLERMRKLAPRGTVAITELELAETALAAARITAAQREHALSERTLLAPFDGVTGISQVDPGERVSETTSVTTLDDRSTLLVDFDVPEAYASGAKIGATLDITAWAVSGRRFEGRIASIGSQIDPATRTLRVRAAVPNEEDLLRPGMSFVVRLPLRGQRYPSVPSVAVQWDRQGAYVWRIADGRADRVTVRILKRTEDAVLVDAALDAGDRVVVEGVQRMQEGVPIRLLAEDEQGGEGRRG